MSEMVDLLLEGLVCEQCGIYLEEAVGYPRKCRTCEGLTDGEYGAEEEEEEREFPFECSIETEFPFEFPFDQRSIGRPQALPGQ